VITAVGEKNYHIWRKVFQQGNPGIILRTKIELNDEEAMAL
jgi:hypothetical protein